MTHADLNLADWLERLQSDDHAELYAARTALQLIGRRQDGLARQMVEGLTAQLTSDERTQRRAARHALVHLCGCHELVVAALPGIVAGIAAKNGEIRSNARALVAALMEKHADCAALHEALRPLHLLVTPMSFSPEIGWHCVMTYQDGGRYYSDKPHRRTPAHHALRAAHAERWRYGWDHLACFVIRATLEAGEAGCIPARQSIWLMQRMELRADKIMLPHKLRDRLLAAEAHPPTPPRTRKDLLPKGGAGVVAVDSVWC